MAKSKPLPPIDELRKRFAYRSDGVLIWKRSQRYQSKAGCAVGTLDKGYLRFEYNGKMWNVHRVIWALLKREDPLNFQIDHINGNRSDNRIENLRKATPGQNQRNRRDGKGYFFNKKKKKWEAQIYLNDKKRRIGYFNTEEQAREAYLRAKEKLHGEFMPTDMKHELGQIDGPTSQLNIFDD